MAYGPSMRTVGQAVLIAGGATLAYSLWEAQAFVVREETVPVLPAGTAPIRILHLSDLHVTPDQHRKIAWLRSLADLEPDLIVSTGDHLAHPDAVPVLLDAIDPLLERPGVFVFGSNDYYGPVLKNPLGYLRPGPSRLQHGVELPVDDLREGLSASGWHDLNNARAQLDVGLRIDAAGVDDPHIGRDDYSAVAGPPDPDAHLALGVTHAPYLRVLDAMKADGRQLLLAGHTHGGQICVPGYGALVTNCDLEAARASGLSSHPAGVSPVHDDAAWLNVSAGIGTSPFTPVRLACRPEAVVLTLVPRTVTPLADG